jgi:hypothetical protein
MLAATPPQGGSIGRPMMVCRAGVLQIATLILFVSGSMEAFATAQRSFVASTGSDASPTCSLAAPCRSFGAAISQTNPGGEVIVLDSAGYGTVTITQPVSIVAPPGVYAGISVPLSGNETGVFIAGAAGKVLLRGLTINGIGGTTGVWFHNGQELAVQDCVISNLSNGVLVDIGGKVSISGSVIRDNTNGIVAGYGASVTVSTSQVLLNSEEGIEIYGGSGGTTTIDVSDTVVSGSAYCIDNFASGGNTGYVHATRVTVTQCSYGIANEPTTAGATTVGYSTVTSSPTVGMINYSGSFYSLGNNMMSDNVQDLNGVITTIGGK